MIGISFEQLVLKYMLVFELGDGWGKEWDVGNI